MALKAFRRVRTDREDVKQLQDAVANTFQTILGRQIIDGLLLEDVELVTGSIQTVEHKLGRKLAGYIVVKRDAEATVWDSQAASTLPEKTLSLNVSANVTVSLWVF